MDNIRTNTNSGNNAADSNQNKISEMISGVADPAAGNATPALDRVAQMAHQAVNKAADAAAPTVDWLDQKSENLMAGRRKAVASAHQYVSAHPWKTIGLMLVTGLLIGRFLR